MYYVCTAWYICPHLHTYYICWNYCGHFIHVPISTYKHMSNLRININMRLQCIFHMQQDQWPWLVCYGHLAHNTHASTLSSTAYYNRIFYTIQLLPNLYKTSVELRILHWPPCFLLTYSPVQTCIRSRNVWIFLFLCSSPVDLPFVLQAHLTHSAVNVTLLYASPKATVLVW